MKEKVSIIVMSLPLSVGHEKAYEMVMDDRILIDMACRFADGLRRKNIEVFERKQNVLATEQGYYFTIYEQDVVEVESGQYKPENTENT